MHAEPAQARTQRLTGCRLTPSHAANGLLKRAEAKSSGRSHSLTAPKANLQPRGLAVGVFGAWAGGVVAES